MVKISLFTETSKHQIAVLGIILVFIVEMFAIYNGIDGINLSLAIGAITTMVGFCFGVWWEKKAH